MNFKPLVSKLRSNLSIVFWLMLVILLLVEGLVLKKAYDKIAIARTEVEIKVSRQVRINQAAYNDAVRRVESGSSYSPQPPLDSSPFGIIDVSKK